MDFHPTLCLHVPVNVSTNGRLLCGDLFLPKAPAVLRLCVLQGESAVTSRRLGSLLANAETATLSLCTDAPLSADEAIGILEWIRSRRLLQHLAVKVIAPAYFLTALRERSARTKNRATDAADRFRAEDTSSSARTYHRLPARANGARRLRPASDPVPA